MHQTQESLQPAIQDSTAILKQVGSTIEVVTVRAVGNGCRVVDSTLGLWGPSLIRVTIVQMGTDEV